MKNDEWNCEGNTEYYLPAETGFVGDICRAEVLDTVHTAQPTLCVHYMCTYHTIIWHQSAFNHRQ
jgi:hypothetical protein